VTTAHIALITCPGVLPSGEQFDYGFWVANTGGVDISQTDATAAGNAWNTSLAAQATFRALFTTTTQFSSTKASIYNTATGTIISSAPGGIQFTGSATSQPLPPQISTCVTLRTQFAGRSFRGRFYLPPGITANMQSNGRMLGTTITGLLTNLNTAALAMQSAVPNCSIGVYSRALHAWNKGTFFDIGDVFDTQRRRRDKLVESRQTALVP
jgi:hypothetical protein